MANALESDIHTVFNSKHKSIYEVVQNADDCMYRDGRPCEVEFRILGKNLLISYTGKHFEYNDVERICSYATHDSLDESVKTQDMSKTGYKGVGFKAAFCVSNKVTVISRDYCFRFDQEYWQDAKYGQTATAKYPWPIIPIPSS